MSEESKTESENPESEVDIHFTPIVQLAPVDVSTLEDDEDEIFKMRSKLFRFDSLSEPAEWKERGLGDIRLLKNKSTGRIRLLMRREKTLKICCNHFLHPSMTLKPHSGSDRAFVWTTMAEYADEEVKQELLAIRFRNAEMAEKFKTTFESCLKEISNLKQVDTDDDDEKENQPSSKSEISKNSDTNTTEEVESKLHQLSVKDSNS